MSCASFTDQLVETDVNKWTDNIGHLMGSKAGRERFINYLLERELIEAFETVDFINKCDEIISQIEAPGRNWSSMKRNKLQELVESSRAVNWYENEEREVKNILNETDEKKICDTLNKAKAKAMELLREEHEEFSKYILKEFQRSCKAK